MDHFWLRSLFSGFGRVSKLFVSYNANKFGRKFGFVSFARREEAVEAISYLNNCWVHDGRIKVCFARIRSISNSSLHQEDEIAQKDNGLPLVTYSSSVEDKEWLNRSLIGHVRFSEAVEAVMEKLLLDIPFKVTLTMITAAKMLITFENKEELNSVMQEGASWIEEAFDKVEIWSPNVVCSDKYLKVRIEGVPLHAWNFEFFSALCSNWGVLVSLDEDAMARRRLDCCQLILRVYSNPLIPSVAWVLVDGTNFKIKIFQEIHEYVSPIVLSKSNFARFESSSAPTNILIEEFNSKDSFVPDSQIGDSNFLGSTPISANGNKNSNFVPEIEEGEIQGKLDGNQLMRPAQFREINSVNSSPDIPPGFENTIRNSNLIPSSQPLIEDNQTINGKLISTPSINVGSMNGDISPQPITISQSLRRSARRSKSKSTFRKVLFDLDGLNKENCKENKLPLSAEDVLSTGMQLGMIMEVPIAQATHNIQTILDAEASREVISNS